MRVTVVCLCAGVLATDAPGGEPADAHSRLRPAIVRIHTGEHFRGSGCVVHEDKGTLYVLTAGHVVNERAADLSVQFFGVEGEEPVRVEKRARILAAAASPDVACLAVSKGDYSGPFLTPAEGWPGKPPFDAVSFGCDAGAAPTLAKVRVAAKKLVRPPGLEGSLHWQAEHVPARGRSGGPLLTGDGDLIGICSGTSGEKGYYSTIGEIRFALKAEGLDWVLE